MTDVNGQNRVPDTAGDAGVAPMQLERTPSLVDTCRGKRRKYLALKPWEYAFIALTVLSLVAMFVLTLYKVSTVSDRDADFTFGLVLLVSFGFCMYYTVYGVLQERWTLIGPLCVDIGTIFIYLVVNYCLGKQDGVKLARLIIAGVNLLLLCAGFYLGYRYYPLGSVLWKTAGAGPSQEMYVILYLCFDLLLFDLQISVSMVVFTMTSRRRFDTEDGVILGVGLFIAVVWFLLSHWSLKQERKLFAWIALGTFLIQPAYVCYRLSETTGDEALHFPGLAPAIYVCTAVALIARFVLLVVGVLAYRNFDKGVKEAAHGTFQAEPQTDPNTQV